MKIKIMTYKLHIKSYKVIIVRKKVKNKRRRQTSGNVLVWLVRLIVSI